MKRVQGSEGVRFLECINPIKNKWAVRFDVRKKPDSGVSYMEEVINHRPVLDEIKAIVATGMDVFDHSPEVNRFTVNDVPMWLDKQTRSNLSNTISMMQEGEKAATLRLWDNGLPPVSFDIPIGQLKGMLSALELYAKTTYDAKQSNKAAVYALDTQEAVLSYNIRMNYPERLSFKL